jgi:hypothetical protein
LLQAARQGVTNDNAAVRLEFARVRSENRGLRTTLDQLGSTTKTGSDAHSETEVAL